MAITFVGSAVDDAINGGTCAVVVDAIGLAQNDVTIAFACSTSGTAANPSGYTAIDNFSLGGGVFVGTISYKVQTATPDTTVSFYDTGTNAHSGTAIIIAFRGVDTTTPQDVATVENLTSTDPTSITPSSNDCAIVVFGGSNALDSDIGTITDYTHPAAHTITSNDDNDTTSAVAYRILTGGAGSPENPGNWSSWTAGTQAVSYTLALRPAAAAAGQPAVKRIGGIRFAGDHRSGGGFSSMWRTRLAYG